MKSLRDLQDKANTLPGAIQDDMLEGLDNVLQWDLVPRRPQADQAFFGELPTTHSQPINLLCTTRTHPDTVLRRLGIIEGRGYGSKGRPAFFDARRGKWVYEGTQHPVGSVQDIKCRTDKQPKGIVQVIGGLQEVLSRTPAESHAPISHIDARHDVSLRDLVDPSVVFKSADLVQRIHVEKEKRQQDNHDHSGSSDSGSPRPDLPKPVRMRHTASPRPDTAERLDSLKLFHQYLSKGVVEAARRTESCIVAPGDGKLSVFLAAGVQSKQDQGVGGGVHNTSIRPTRTLLVGISGWGEDLVDADCPQPRRLNEFFTHHVVIERNTQPDEFEETADDAFGVMTPIQGLKYDKLIAQARAAKKLTERLREANANLFSNLTGSSEKEKCRGFRCGHVTPEGNPIVEGLDGMPLHCRVREANTAVDGESCGSSSQYYSDEEEEEDEDDDSVDRHSRAGGVDNLHDGKKLTAAEQEELRLKVLQRRKRLQKVCDADNRFIESLSNQGWQRVRRVCECGTDLGPFDIAKCVCGKYDFEHIPREVKNNRKKQLAKVIKDVNYLNFASFMACPVSRRPTQHDVHRYTTDLLMVLSEGFHPDTDRNKWLKHAPPRRRAIPVVSVLFGGTSTDKFHLIHHVQRRWPIVVIEGSGGYADTLCSIINKVRQIVKVAAPQRGAQGEEKEKVQKPVSQAGLDEFRKFLSGIDSTTAEILVNGHVEVILKGSKTTEFGRKIENCLNGNETLEKAWMLYSQWGHNAAYQKYRYFWFNIMIVIIAVITTAASVSQSFLLLIKEDQSPPHMFKQPEPIWLVLRWSVIALPIVSTLLQAIANKYAPGPKWVRLKSASERLLSEIYKYRTHTMEYASNKMKARQDGGRDKKSPAGDDGAAFSTREELLQQRCHMLTDFLSESEVANVTLKPYEGSLPPKHIKRNGDDGFSELGPDKYMRIRLETKIAELEKRAIGERRTIATAVLVINICNALGTMLAALAAYGMGYMQAWVALTTALASSVIRWLDFSRLQYLNSKINVTINNLGSVVVWWAGQGANADNKEDRDRLVEDTENFILEETLLWSKIIHGAKDSANDSSEEPHRDGKSKGKSEGEKLKLLGSKHGIELEDLTGEKLYEALDKPTGSTSKGVKEAMKKLAQLGLAPPQKPTAPPSEITATEPSAEAEADLQNNMVVTPKPPGWAVSSDILQCLRFQQTKTRLLTMILKVNNHQKGINAWSIHNAMRDIPELYRLVKDLRTRHLLEVVKTLTVESLYDYFVREEHFRGMGDGLGRKAPKRGDLLPRCESDTDEIYHMENFLSEFRGLARMEQGSQLTSTGILNFIKDPTIKSVVRKLPPEMWLSLRDAAVDLWELPVNGEFMTRDHSTAVLLEDVTELIAELDVDDLLQNFDTRVRLWIRAPSFSESATSVLSKQQLLQGLPATAVRSLEGRSTLQIQKYFRQFSRGTEAARVFRQVHQKFDSQLKGYHNGKVFHPTLGDLELRERLVLSCEMLDQIAINRQSRGALMKKLKICTVYNEQVDRILVSMKEAEFKFLLSTMQAKMNNTYASRIVDRAADELNSFDCRKAIPCCEALKLVSRLKDFQRMQMYARETDAEPPHPHSIPPPETSLDGADAFKGFSVANLTRSQIFCMLDYRSLIKQLMPLTEEQLKELLMVMLGLSARSYPILVFAKIREKMPILNIPQLNDIVQDFDPEFVDNLIYVAWNNVGTINMLHDQHQENRARLTHHRMLELVSSNLEVTEGLRLLSEASTDAGMNTHEIGEMLLILMKIVVDQGGDRMTSVAFESAGVTSGFPHDLQRLFPGPEERQQVAMLFATLPTLELHRLLFSEGDAPVMKSPDELFSNLFADGGRTRNPELFPRAYEALCTLKTTDDRKFVKIVAHLVLELTIDTPLRMFHDLASRISMFDLRDVFLGYECRRPFFLFIFEFYFAPGVTNNPLDLVQSDQLSLAEKWLGRRIGEVNIPGLPSSVHDAQRYPAGKWRTALLRHLTRRVSESPEYSSLLEGLRALTELQLKVLVEEACSFMSGTVCGKLYVSYLTKARESCRSDVEWSHWLQHNMVVDLLRQRMKHSPDSVSKQFDDFDADVFYLRYPEAKERAVASLVFTEQSRQLILEMHPHELDRDLFTYLKHFGPIPRATYLKITRRFRNEQWRALVHKTDAVSAWRNALSRRDHEGSQASHDLGAFPGALT